MGTCPQNLQWACSHPHPYHKIYWSEDCSSSLEPFQQLHVTYRKQTSWSWATQSVRTRSDGSSVNTASPGLSEPGWEVQADPAKTVRGGKMYRWTSRQDDSQTMWFMEGYMRQCSPMCLSNQYFEELYWSNNWRKWWDIFTLPWILLKSLSYFSLAVQDKLHFFGGTNNDWSLPTLCKIKFHYIVPTSEFLIYLWNHS